MKKLIAIFCAAFFMISTPAFAADIGFGVSASFTKLESDGAEKELTGDEESNEGSASEDVLIGEAFLEVIAENGLVFGVSYVPVRELGSKSRTDALTDHGGNESGNGDTGTYTAKAELESLYMLYSEIPFGPLYAKVGLQRADLTSLESLNSASTYENISINGTTFGLGYKSDLGTNLYYKGEVTRTIFDDISINNNNNTHAVHADIDATSLRLSLGYKF